MADALELLLLLLELLLLGALVGVEPGDGLVDGVLESVFLSSANLVLDFSSAGVVLRQ